ncbi:MAG: hypothetical protein ABEK03_09125 [Candidatus Bipolaricaulia bacterium]
MMEPNGRDETRTVESQHCPHCDHMVEIRESSGGFLFRYDCEEQPASPAASR